MQPQFPEAQMHLVRPKEPVIGRVVETRVCTAGGKKAAGIVRHVAIDVSGTPLEANFLVGQSFGVIPPGLDEHGKPHAVRLYSIASPSFGEDGAGQVLATTVKRTIIEREPLKEGDDPEDHRLFLGVASNYLCDMRVGDEVRVCGPQGKRFLLPVDRGAHDYIFIATGTGIAPFRGMVMELLEAPAGPVDREIHLIMGSPYRSDLIYDELFRGLQQAHANFHYHTAISREVLNGSTGRGEYTHHALRRQRDVFSRLLCSDSTLIYVCGLLGMQFEIYREIAEVGAAEALLQVKDDLAPVPAKEWTIEQMKRSIRPGHRLMLEVY